MSVGAVTLTIIGNRDFFDRTSDLRNDLKDMGGTVLVEERLEKDAREPGLVTIERAEPNPDHIMTGIIHVVDAPPSYENRIPATQATKEGLAVGVEFSILRPDLARAIRREIGGLAGEYMRN